ncbi:MAG: hypothetical protein JXX28_03830 [Deltaproteobacteria bacterium]|nr:hypothetical protein [Deltaproteobacteria bacterium]
MWWWIAAAALANGDGSHLWISETARDQLPVGALRDFLEDPAAWEAVRAGSLFPDGGYGVDHPYGEHAHWPPFHRAYRGWIAARWQPPYQGEAALHLGLLLGMISHGTADQVYDGLYMERAREEDGGSDWGQSFDEATEVCFLAATGPQELPPLELPYDALAALLTADGVAVDANTLRRGQAAVNLAVLWASGASQDPERVAAYQAQFPWGCVHQIDEDQPGAPAHEARVVAHAWAQTWAALSGDLAPGGVLDSSPLDGGAGLPEAGVGARVGLFLASPLLSAQVPELALRVVDEAGVEVEISRRLFYRDHSQLLLIEPVAGWTPRAAHTLTLGPVDDAWGEALLTDPWRLHFSTAPPPADTGEVREEPAPSGCSQAGRGERWGPLGLLALGALRRRRRCQTPHTDRQIGETGLTHTQEERVTLPCRRPRRTG